MARLLAGAPFCARAYYAGIAKIRDYNTLSLHDCFLHNLGQQGEQKGIFEMKRMHRHERECFTRISNAEKRVEKRCVVEFFFMEKKFGVGYPYERQS